MKTWNSISGGKSSAYIAANYPADYNVFSLVRIEDERAKFKDEKLRRLVEDKIQAPFIGTAEDDTIIHTMLDLEQYIGREITWVTGPTFDQVLSRSKNGKLLLPNKIRRFCTTDMKVEPMFYWWAENVGEPVETRIGFRANEHRRAKTMLEKCDKNGLVNFKASFERHKNGNRKWEMVPYQKPKFPLIENGIFKDQVDAFWKDKPVRFAWMNNCVGCFHKHPTLIKKMWEKHPDKLQWFSDKEQQSIKDYNNTSCWIQGITYEKINKWRPQSELFDDDFNECDSGYCGL